MAEYTWDKAKQAGYKADIVPFTRQTIINIYHKGIFLMWFYVCNYTHIYSSQ